MAQPGAGAPRDPAAASTHARRWPFAASVRTFRAMPHIHQVPVAEATGLLRKLFDAALERAGRVWNIVHVMSLNPRAMDASMKFYAAIMFGPSPLTRVQREMLATVTSKAQDCFY